ncbi:sugar phosphate isomerase/epimerase family protein [Tautonia sociabilis]|uniref:Sugar phosphate isomerase/epimerase n=1 Tax=Tautonia sociabilis TaxID=2080755 RepID=A0A432MPN8_9BACT|nr:sugar phosphate isomerase/epimerase [Tautonia sociabilis]RUL89414.1 sugar phosphate isomerase/epimerase [Tautonia sociabilis]
MQPCFNQATTLGTPFEAEIPALGRAGWRAVELWLTKLEEFLRGRPVGEARALLDGEGILPVAASFQGGLLLSRGQERQAHWDHFRRRLDLLAELGVPTLVVAPDFVSSPESDDLHRAAASLIEAAELAGPKGVRLAIEFQKTARFCASLDTTIALVAQSGAPGVGVCFDAFHYYTGPSKFEDLAYLSPENLTLVQVCDLSGVPRELASDSDRILPGEGDLPLGPILDHFARIGYRGPVSLEVLNPMLWEMPADRVVGIALQALERTLASHLAPPPGAESESVEA